MTRLELIIATLFGLLLFAAAWSFWQLQTSETACETAARNLSDCQQLAVQIVALRDRPTRAVLTEQSGTELASQIEQTATVSQIPVDALLRIDPQPSRRITDTPYKEQTTQVELRSVTLRQLFTFLHLLLTEHKHLAIHNLRLTAPRNESTSPTVANQETWHADLTLTSLLYAPVSQSR